MPAPPMRAPAWAWASTGGKTVRVGYVNALNYEKGGEGEYKQGAGGDVLGQGVIAACGDGVSGLELCIARCVLCPGHIGDGGQQTDDHGQSQQQRQNFLIDLLYPFFKMGKEGESGTGECRGSDSRGQKCSGRALLPEHAAIYTGNEPFNRHWGEGGIRRPSGGWSPADARGGAGTKNRRRRWNVSVRRRR